MKINDEVVKEAVKKKQIPSGMILQKELDVIISKFKIIHPSKRLMNVPEIENEISNMNKTNVVDSALEGKQKTQKIQKGAKGKKILLIKDVENLSLAKIERTEYTAPEFVKLDANSITLAKGKRNSTSPDLPFLRRSYHRNFNG